MPVEGDNRLGYKIKLMREANECYCVCEALRLAYDIVHEFKDTSIKDALTELLVDAFMQVKKMHDRLVYYRDTYEPERANEQHDKLDFLPGRLEKLAMRRQRKVT